MRSGVFTAFVMACFAVACGGRSDLPVPPPCKAADCKAGAFCWLGECVQLTAITAGSVHACALTSMGGVQCWGANYAGQLGWAGHNYTGDGADANEASPIPVPVSGLSAGVAAVSAGWEGTCALTTAGGVQCWGHVGDLLSGLPVDILGPSQRVGAISVGTNHACALTSEGAVVCWGSTEPVAVSGLPSGIKAIAAGGCHDCALTAAGGVLCWGCNHGGTLGNNSTVDSSVPVAVSGLSTGVAGVAAGIGYTCALTTKGGVLCWGGIRAPGDPLVLVPTAISGLSSGVAALALAATFDYSGACALMISGDVTCWNRSGMPHVILPGGAGGIAAYAFGEDEHCALTTAGRAKCRGLHDDGLVDIVEP